MDHHPSCHSRECLFIRISEQWKCGHPRQQNPCCHRNSEEKEHISQIFHANECNERWSCTSAPDFRLNIWILPRLECCNGESAEQRSRNIQPPNILISMIDLNIVAHKSDHQHIQYYAFKMFYDNWRKMCAKMRKLKACRIFLFEDCIVRMQNAWPKMIMGWILFSKSAE